MDFWYTVRNVYDKNDNDGLSWKRCLEWSKLTHLKEVISLDASFHLNLFCHSYVTVIVADDARNVKFIKCTFIEKKCLFIVYQ
ncbi:hypothetical protein SAMN04488522_101296 [Pedobacter caeni]|uniref:Uncharacterized protein n=1 Tax=Pedobacter caeni TaxID=288992 RepID=A0A1M4TS43_9SPHI|nr:hypothetical protein SAMN04488522_101296 [Pedobacter caeni]